MQSSEQTTRKWPAVAVPHVDRDVNHSCFRERLSVTIEDYALQPEPRMKAVPQSARGERSEHQGDQDDEGHISCMTPVSAFVAGLFRSVRRTALQPPSLLPAATAKPAATELVHINKPFAALSAAPHQALTRQRRMARVEAAWRRPNSAQLRRRHGDLGHYPGGEADEYYYQSAKSPVCLPTTLTRQARTTRERHLQRKGSPTWLSPAQIVDFEQRMTPDVMARWTNLSRDGSLDPPSRVPLPVYPSSALLVGVARSSPRSLRYSEQLIVSDLDITVGTVLEPAASPDRPFPLEMVRGVDQHTAVEEVRSHLHALLTEFPQSRTMRFINDDEAPPPTPSVSLSDGRPSASSSSTVGDVINVSMETADPLSDESIEDIPEVVRAVHRTPLDNDYSDSSELPHGSPETKAVGSSSYVALASSVAFSRANIVMIVRAKCRVPLDASSDANPDLGSSPTQSLVLGDSYEETEGDQPLHWPGEEDHVLSTQGQRVDSACGGYFLDSFSQSQTWDLRPENFALRVVNGDSDSDSDLFASPTVLRTEDSSLEVIDQALFADFDETWACDEGSVAQVLDLSHASADLIDSIQPAQSEAVEPLKDLRPTTTAVHGVSEWLVEDLNLGYRARFDAWEIFELIERETETDDDDVPHVGELAPAEYLREEYERLNEREVDPIASGTCNFLNFYRLRTGIDFDDWH